MNYRIKRGDQEFGPYTLAESGTMYRPSTSHPTWRLARDERVDSSSGPKEYSNSACCAKPGAFGVTDPDVSSAPQTVPLPPNLPWPVLLICYLSYLPFPLLKTVSLFTIVWSFIQANWARKLSGKNTALVLVSMNVAGLFSGAPRRLRSAALHMEALAGFEEVDPGWRYLLHCWRVLHSRSYGGVLQQCREYRPQYERGPGLLF